MTAIERARRGMTLMEVVIALTLLALLAGIGQSAFATIIDRQATIRTASTDVERAAALREMIRQWILQGTIQIQRGGLPQGARGGPAQTLAAVAPGMSGSSSSTTGVTAAASTGHELTVTTSAPNPLMAANVRIRLFVDADDATPERGLTIEYQASTQTPLMRRQLDPDIGDLKVEFYDSRTNRWYDDTQASTIQPIAVRLSMVAVEGKTVPRLLALPLTIVYGEVTP